MKMVATQRTFRIEVVKIMRTDGLPSEDDQRLHTLDGTKEDALSTMMTDLLDAIQLLYTDSEYKSMYFRVSWV